MGSAYFGSRDKNLLISVHDVYMNEEDEQEEVRTQAFVCLMQLLGISSVELMNKNDDIIFALEDIKLENFIYEMNILSEIIKK